MFITPRVALPNMYPIHSLVLHQKTALPDTDNWYSFDFFYIVELDLCFEI